jgi:hypothetical protein
MTKRETVLQYIRRHPGTTQIKIISALGNRFFDATPQYGAQRKASSIIASLRRSGLIQDVSRRCRYCGAARTRGLRNVKLYATIAGNLRVIPPIRKAS